MAIKHSLTSVEYGGKIKVMMGNVKSGKNITIIDSWFTIFLNAYRTCWFPSRPSKGGIEILSLVNQALSTMLNGRDTETLAPNELLVRICPDTKRPVLVCHDGNGQCLCLHNGTTEEDAVDVDLWLRSNSRECNGYNKLQEAVVDLAYNAGADNLWEDMDSRAVNAEIIRWAEEFETEHAGTDWDAEDYFLAIDRFYREKTKQMNPVTIPAN